MISPETFFFRPETPICKNTFGAYECSAERENLFEILAGNQLRYLPWLWKAFRLSFNFCPRQMAGDHFAGIFKLGLGGDGDFYGDNSPSITFQPNSSKLLIESALNNDITEMYLSEENLALDEFHNIAISQVRNN